MTGSTDLSEVTLRYANSAGESYDLAFGLQFYRPSNGTTAEGEPTLASGAYIFKPKMDDQASHPYSMLSSYTVQPAEQSDG